VAGIKYAARPLIASCQDKQKTMMLKNGRTVYGFSAEKPDRIRNVTLCGFWVDEARECKELQGLMGYPLKAAYYQPMARV